MYRLKSNCANTWFKLLLNFSERSHGRTVIDDDSSKSQKLKTKKLSNRTEKFMRLNGSNFRSVLLNIVMEEELL